MSVVDAAIVGSGPNGLSAAIALARAGLRVRVHEAEPTIGGGSRSEALTLPGFIHDTCSAIHPMGIASPFFATLGLGERGLEWIQPDIPVAHALDDGTAVALHRSIDATARGLGADGASYRRLIGPLASRFDALLEDILIPIAHAPRHPLLLARFGIPGLLPAATVARASFRGERARALFGGLAGHSLLPLGAPFSTSFALVLAAAGHAVGWPMPRGGAQRIADALAAELRALGGEIVTGDRVRDVAQLSDTRAVLFDTSARALEAIAGARFSEAYRRTLRRYRQGPGVFKVDYALAAPVPWRAAECRSAGTIHLGGTLDEIARSEDQVGRGEHSKQPFVIAAQPSVFDPSRAPAGKHTLWAYCHVPNGSTVDMSTAIDEQLERFAPGFRDIVLARKTWTSRDIEAHNATCVGGDIAGGSHTGLQVIARPRLFDPYATPDRAIYLCSSATPPGAGVHGMCGANAARSALRRAFA